MSDEGSLNNQEDNDEQKDMIYNIIELKKQIDVLCSYLAEHFQNLINKINEFQTYGNMGNTKEEEIVQKIDKFMKQNPQQMIQLIHKMANKLINTTIETNKQLTQINDEEEIQNFQKIKEDIHKKTMNEQRFRSKITCLEALAEYKKNIISQLEQERDSQRFQITQMSNRIKKETWSREENHVPIKTPMKKTKGDQNITQNKFNRISRSNTNTTYNYESAKKSNQIDYQINDISPDIKSTSQLKYSRSKIFSSQTQYRSTTEKAEVYQKISKDHHKQEFQIKKLKIQQEQKSSDNLKLQHKYDEQKEIIGILNAQKQEILKKVQIPKVTFDQNPNYIKHFKDEVLKKNKEINHLKKMIAKSSIVNRQCLVKEKVFDQERADYHFKVIDQSDRIKKLQNLFLESDNKSNDKVIELIESHKKLQYQLLESEAKQKEIKERGY